MDTFPYIDTFTNMHDLIRLCPGYRPTTSARPVTCPVQIRKELTGEVCTLDDTPLAIPPDSPFFLHLSRSEFLNEAAD